MSHFQLQGCQDPLGEVPLARLHIPTGTQRWWLQPMPFLASWIPSGLVLQSQVIAAAPTTAPLAEWFTGALFQPFQLSP